MFIVNRDCMINIMPMDVNEETFSPVLVIVWLAEGKWLDTWLGG